MTDPVAPELPSLFVENDIISVQTTAPIDKLYDYKVGPEQSVQIGQLVDVPFGRQSLTAIVRGPGNLDIPTSKIKYLNKVYPYAPFSKAQLKFSDFLKKYTLSSYGAVAKLSIPSKDLLKPIKQIKQYYRTGLPVPDSLRLTAPRQAVLDFMKEGLPPVSLDEIIFETGASKATIDGLCAVGLLCAQLCDLKADAPKLYPRHKNVSLNPDQQLAATNLRQRVIDQKFSTSLLDGVTGAGKTEVYLEAISEALKEGQQILVLLPEIALSTQLLKRFEDRFGAPAQAWHSELTPAARRKTWQSVNNGRAQLIVGARSALFLPFQNLGLIIVDEEHEPAFKQEEGVRYHGRDMAILRAKCENCPIILASATPSLESMQNALSGRYEHLILSARHGSAGLPNITLIDLRREKLPPRRFISAPLEAAIQNCLSQKKQAMLYLNRRGYAPLTLCRACGFRIQCPQCSAWLVEHRRHNRLICHHCGHGMPKPEKCPNCYEEDSMAACGPGVERIAEEAQHLFPEAKIELMVSDLFSSTSAVQNLIDRMQNKEIDILVGTQLMAKGHNFPDLTHVGVVDGDLGLEGGDLRASERTYQLLHQVSGRAGRAQDKGHVYIQTYLPNHPVMQALKAEDRDGFIATETSERQAANMPPFARLAALILSGPNEDTLDQFCKEILVRAPSYEDVLILGPAPAQLALIRGRHRRRFLIRAGKHVNLQKVLGDWVSLLKPPKEIRLHIDIDPYNFM